MERRYTLTNFLDALDRPRLILNEVRRVVDYPSETVWNRYFDVRYGDGIDIAERDWDNLILLDACRYDYFADQNTIPGNLSKVVSAGSKSWTFLQRNFADRHLHDTVYVSANPFIERLDSGTFYAVRSLLDQWTHDPGTVMPESVVEAALDAYQSYPDKRLIVHFMQPHRPYIGPTAEEIRDEFRLRGWGVNHPEATSEEGISLWKAAKSGRISDQKIRMAYSETLDIVLEHARTLINSLNGKTVVSSDHGEMLGESILPHTRPIYGHSTGVQSRKLRMVPWLEIPTGSRREISEGEPQDQHNHDEEMVTERLQALGYTE